MSDSSRFPSRHGQRVSRRVFLHSTSVIPAALASPGLLLPAGTITLTGAAADDDNASGDLDIFKDLTIGGYVTVENRQITINRKPPARW